MMALTDNQRAVLSFIQHYIAENDVSPKLQEIAEGIGIRSRGVAHRYVQALVDAGFLAIDRGRHRGIRLLKEHSHTPPHKDTMPLLGKIAAGSPIEAIPGEDEINLTDFFGKNNFAVRVQGDSMVDAGIYDGDIAIIEFRETANNGDIVVALIDEQEATLKRFKSTPHGRFIQLVPENRGMETMVYEASRVRIQGVLVGQLRKYT
ncbi:MAG: transcriptional repressor LexA [Gammaproteobacteria bacterium]|nr:transcriptional repressor LexA [Gammaproteobacteria bacterium]